MKTITRIAVCLAVLWLGWRFFQFLFPDDTTRIQRKLTRLESLVSYGPSTSPLAHLAAAGSIQEMFDSKAELNIRTDVGTWNLNGRDEIKTAVLSARQQEPQGMEVRITDPIFESSGDGTMTCIATVTAQTGNSPDPMVRILEFHWRKGERSQWLIQRIVTRKDLEWGTE